MRNLQLPAHQLDIADLCLQQCRLGHDHRRQIIAAAAPVANQRTAPCKRRRLVGIRVGHQDAAGFGGGIAIDIGGDHADADYAGCGRRESAVCRLRADLRAQGIARHFDGIGCQIQGEAGIFVQADSAVGDYGPYTCVASMHHGCTIVTDPGIPPVANGLPMGVSAPVLTLMR